ncbi:hypothetical protein A1OE_1031 [Candidatus Endolissoclinum faulkneri L2]|uniref:Uncharacterized protein n=1 Tax=Candidatus Endolissoclinum faulkneri L2 TaxID=1193729 RepID=K7YHY6_9PROT|nr:hypothetical protein A1OE_1031 [Candidatus Endolissoclinum faulkneri L2]
MLKLPKQNITKPTIIVSYCRKEIQNKKQLYSCLKKITNNLPKLANIKPG